MAYYANPDLLEPVDVEAPRVSDDTGWISNQSDADRAKQIVREVFLWDLKGEIGRMARLGVPLADRQDIAARLERCFARIREDERSKR